MFPRPFTTPAGTNITIGMAEATTLRLGDTCFRKTDRPLAGNFIGWRSLSDILNDENFMSLLLQELDMVIAGLQGDRARRYFSTVHTRPVGWSGTMPLRDIALDETERFAPNNSCTALRVKEDSECVAPLSHEVTFSVDFMKIRDQWNLMVLSVYPGQNIGPLRSGDRMSVDITEREGVVFLRWTHPGEPLTQVT
jgi:hypothetical protein